MDFKDYYSTLGVAKTATAKGDQAGLPQAGAQASSRRQPGRQAAEAKFKEINEAYEVLGDPEKRKKYDELGANWRAYEQAGRAAQGGQPVGGRNVNSGGQAGGFRTMTEEEMHEMFGDAIPFSDFFHTFFGGAAAGRRIAGDAPRGGARPRAARAGRDVEHEIELDARGRLSAARPGASRIAARRPGAHRRRPDSRRRQRRIARARRRRRRARRPAARKSGDLYLRIRLAPHPQFERKGTRPLHARRRAADDRGARRRGRGPDARRQVAAAEDSADDAERAGVPPEGPRHAGRRQDATSTAISTRPSTCSCRSS